MAAFEMRTNEHLNRTQMWDSTLKTLALDTLQAQKFVRQLNLPSDAGSSTYTIPSLGEATVNTFVEGGRVKYDRLDTGEYNFTITEYKYSANSLSAKFKRDSFWSNEVIASFVTRQHRALMVDYEKLVFSRANTGQTGSAAYSSSPLMPVNGGDHRWVAQGTNNVITYKDFARAQYSLNVANMPMQALTAIVDPATIYALQTQANVTNLMSPLAPQIIGNNTPTGMRFAMNIYGFDVYSSNYLPQGITETIDGTTVTSNGVVNYLFSAAPGDTLPWVGAWTQLPTVDSKWNMDQQEWEYMTICEYGVQGDFRPENLVTVITDKSQIN